MQGRPSSTVVFPSPPPYSPPPSYSRYEMQPVMTSAVTSSLSLAELSITGTPGSSHTGLPVYLPRSASLPQAQASQSRASRARNHVVYSSSNVGRSASRMPLPL
ncbi:hypothetical protein MTO96_045078, partial [Rhipicephalus appendiculatus]